MLYSRHGSNIFFFLRVSYKPISLLATTNPSAMDHVCVQYINTINLAHNLMRPIRVKRTAVRLYLANGLLYSQV
jgi:hypothetical protein